MVGNYGNVSYGNRPVGILVGEQWASSYGKSAWLADQQSGADGFANRGDGKLSPTDVSGLMESGGILTSGVGSLINALKGRPDVVVDTQTGAPAPTTDYTPMILLGVGGIVVLGLAGMAMQGGGRRRR